MKARHNDDENLFYKLQIVKKHYANQMCHSSDIIYLKVAQTLIL